jgi:hypothetical protein
VRTDYIRSWTTLDDMSRQAATPAATLSAVMLKNIDNQTIDGEAKAKPEVIKLGLDLHARQLRSVGNWTVQRPSRRSSGIPAGHSSSFNFSSN